jgi:RimJ/RimL family protein N-acetyltransferase
MVNSKDTNGITDFVITIRDDASTSTPRALLTRTTTPVDPVQPLIPQDSPAIGKIGIYAPLDSSKSGEIGFLLNPSYHRRGLVSEALSAMLSFLFEHRGVETITTDVDPRNEACIGILEKHGFVLIGRAKRTWQIGSEWVNSEYRTLTRCRWEKNRESGS